jgi:pyridoxamine 5'-phosphate oxidase
MAEFIDRRKEYRHGELDESTVDSSPFSQFKHWFDQALQHHDGNSHEHEPNAFALATVGKDLKPSVRMLLLKGIDERGFLFFTNYESRKAEQMAENSACSMLFYWPAHERQIRIEGVAEKVEPEISDTYFSARPRGAQCGATISLQSRVASSRDEIEGAFRAFQEQAGEGPLIRPSYWGGYRVVPTRFEFWQGRESRLHDRVCYSLENSAWKIERLWP